MWCLEGKLFKNKPEDIKFSVLMAHLDENVLRMRSDKCFRIAWTIPMLYIIVYAFQKEHDIHLQFNRNYTGSGKARNRGRCGRCDFYQI